jgi:hypothetical protein
LASWLLIGHPVQLQAGEVIALATCDDLGLLRLPDKLAMHAHQTGNRGVQEQLLVMGLPGEQVRDGDEGYLLRRVPI